MSPNPTPDNDGGDACRPVPLYPATLTGGSGMFATTNETSQARSPAPPADNVPPFVRDYIRRGIAVVPQMPGAKKPCVRWKPYQERLPTEDELRQWACLFWPQAGVAAILGPVSNLFTIDVDGVEAHEALIARLGKEPQVPKVRSGSGDPFRYHLHFLYPTNVRTKAKATPWHPKLEFRGKGGVVILPPSQHKSGNVYEWSPGQSLDDLALTPLPEAILEALETAEAVRQCAPTVGQALPSGRSGDRDKIQQRAAAYLAKMPPAVQGQGGDRQTYTVACVLVQRFGMSIEEALPVMREWNQQCSPPWSEDELRLKLTAAAQEAGPRGSLLTASAGTKPDQEATTPALAALFSSCGLQHPLGMIDKSRAELIECLGRVPRLFGGVANWPMRDTLRSQCTKPGDWASMVRKVSHSPGGMLIPDDEDRIWAVRLIRAYDPVVDNLYHAIGFCGQSVQVLDTKTSLGPMSEVTEAETRQHLGQAASGLVCYEQTEQLLWWCHATFLEQKCTRLRVPDSAPACVIWGNDRKQWPDNWRQRLRKSLKSACFLRWATVQLSDLSDPQFFPSCEPIIRKIRLGAVRDHRFEIHVWSGLVGALERFEPRKDDAGDWHVNLNLSLEEMRGDALADEQDLQGEVVETLPKEKEAEVKAQYRAKFAGIITLPIAILAIAAQAGVPSQERRLIRLMFREISRAEKQKQKGREDKAHLFPKQAVQQVCQGTDAFQGDASESDAFVGFNGNGQLWGRGYRVRTWMFRAGYAFPTNDGSMEAKAVRSFLEDLASTATRFSLLVIGHFRNQRFSLERLQTLAGSQQRAAKLAMVTLRVYTPSDYMIRWQARLAKDMPGLLQTGELEKGEEALSLDRLRAKAGVTKVELAKYLKIGRPYLSKVLRGKKPLTATMATRIWAFLEAKVTKLEEGT